MYCPQCHTSYRPAITTCPRCGSRLVTPQSASSSQLDSDEPSEQVKNADDLVQVFRTNDYSLYLIARSLLESANIDFWGKGDALRSMSIDSIIMVRAADEAEASELLATLELETEEEEAGEGPGE